MSIIADATDKLISSLLAFLLSFGVFSSNPTQIAQQNEAGRQVTLLFAGDVMLGRSVMSTSLNVGDSFYPFRKIADFTKDVDLTIVNLENAIIENCPSQGRGSFTFCTKPEIAEGLVFAGIDVVSLANNHSGNYGNEGLEETKKYLDNMGVNYTGVGELLIKEVGQSNGEAGGIKFGFLGLDYTISKNDLSHDLDLIARSDPAVDVLVVIPHWGDEYQPIANIFQIMAAKQMIENGADLIIGSHPHWVQNSEKIDNVPIYYSLGNLVFDQMWSEETKKGMFVKFEFEKNNDGKVVISNTKEYKTYIPKLGQPEIVNSF